MKRWVVAVLVLNAGLFAAAPQDPLIGLAHSAPPEFAADALLRIAEQAKLAPAAKIELIEEAFRLAQSAHFLMPYRSFRTESDSRAAVQNQAFKLHLDSLSLQTRAVSDLLPLAPAKARQHFEEIRLPPLPALTCADALIPEVSSFYDALGQVFQNAFTPKERAREEHVNFLLSYLSRLASPVQLAPAARLIQTLSLTSSQKDLIFVQFSGILGSMDSPGRLFEATRADIEAALTADMRPAFAKYDSRARTTNLQCKDSDIEANPLWQSSDAKAIFQQARDRRPELLQDVASWAGPFEEKSLIYLALLDRTSEPDFDKTLAAFIGYLNSSTLQHLSPVEWFMPARSLYERFHDSNSIQAERAMAAYRDSANPVLVLYAALDEKYGTKRPSWIGLGAP